MLTGQVPFDGDTAVAVAVKHMNEDIVPPSALNPDIPADLEDIVMRATSKLQINRYRSADEMITALNFIKYSKPVAPQSGAGISGSDTNHSGYTGEHQRKEEGTAMGEEKQNKKGKKKISVRPEKIAVLAIAILLAIPVSGAIYKAMSGGGSQDIVKVPDVVGLTFEEATEALEAGGLLLEVEMELPSSIYEDGAIMSQMPKPDAEVKKGITVRVNISRGQVDGTVPSVEGKPLSGAKYILETYGYKVGSVTELNNDNVPAGIVISQKPAKGTVLSAGGSVNLQVSLGPEFGEFEVVDLRGKTLEEAEMIIESLGLTLGAVTYVANPYVEENCVVSHSPGPGTKVTEPIAVDIVISKTATDKPVPPDKPPVENGESGMNSVAITLDFTRSAKEEFLLTVNVADGVFDPRTPINKEPRNRSDESEVISVSGAGRNGIVKVWYDNELAYNLKVDFQSRKVE